MRGCQVVPISSMNIPTRPIAPAIAKGRYQRIKKSPATTTITRATRQGISLKSSSWVNTSTRTPGTMITKIPTKKIPAPINRSRMNTPAIPAKPSAHSNNHSIRPTENLISCLRRAENPRREEQHRFGFGRVLCQFLRFPLLANFPRRSTGPGWLWLRLRALESPRGTYPARRKDQPFSCCSPPTSVQRPA